VRETLPDSVLEFADEVVFVDVTPDVLRERLRDGKIYPKERIEAALGNFFRTENLAALRELAVRELMHARSAARREQPFARIVLGVAPRERDVLLVRRIGRLARRLDVDLRVVSVVPREPSAGDPSIAALTEAVKGARGSFGIVVASEPAAYLAGMLIEGDVLAVESPRKPRSLFGKRSFAVRLLNAGARELLVLVPRESDQRLTDVSAH
jgi:two-component system sensor histidine kinase KdpD